MSELKDLYYSLGLESSPWYLANSTSRGALELDGYLCDGNKDFTHVKEFAEILKKYQLEDTDDFHTKQFPYMALWRFFKKGSDKELRFMSELALEMRVFRYELDSFISKPYKSKEWSEAFVDLSKEFSYEHASSYSLRRLSA